MNPASKVLVIVLCPKSSEKQKLFAKSIIYLYANITFKSGSRFIRM